MTFDFPIEVLRTSRRKSALIGVENGIVTVSVPKTLSDRRVEELVTSRAIWIRQKLRIQAESLSPATKEYVTGEAVTYLGRNYRLKLAPSDMWETKLKGGYLTVTIPISYSQVRVKASLEQWYRQKALVKFKEKTKRYAAILEVNPKTVELRDYKSRWGACSASGDVSFNWRIIIAPHYIVDYIVVHELCHLLEYNHSPKFWQHVERIIPNYKECREWLKLNGESLRA